MTTSVNLVIGTASTIIGIVLFVNFNAIGQTEKIDSLKEKLSREGESFEIIFELAREHLDLDNRMSLKLARHSNSIANLMKDTLLIVKSLRLTAQAQRRLNNLDSSVYYFNRCLQMATGLNDYKEMHSVLNGTGIAKSYQAKYDEALHYHFQALDLATKNKDSARIDMSFLNLGFVYYKLMNYELALTYYNKSLQMKTALHDQFDLDMLKVNISLCYAFLGQTDNARKRLEPFFEKVIASYNEDFLISLYYASGVIWYYKNSLVDAEKDFLQSYSIAKKYDNPRFVFDNIIFLSKIYLKKNNLHLSEKFLTEGEEMTITSRYDLEEIKLYSELCALYAAKKDYKKLYRVQQKYIHLKDSVFNEEHTNNLMRLHAEATEKENNARLASQKQQAHLKQEIITKQRSVNLSTSLALIILAVITYILFRTLRTRKTANGKLNDRVRERTLELEHNYKDLVRTMKLRDLTLDRISNDLNNSLHVMKTQCSSAPKEKGSMDGQRYFDQIKATTSHLEKSLQSITE